MLCYSHSNSFLLNSEKKLKKNIERFLNWDRFILKWLKEELWTIDGRGRERFSSGGLRFTDQYRFLSAGRRQKKTQLLLEELPTSSMVYHPSTHAFSAIQLTTISFLPTRNGCTMFYEESYALAVLFPYPLSYTHIFN